MLLYFGPAWWVVSVAPLAVTYLSARHLYLASVGVAIGVAVGATLLWETRRPVLRVLGAAGCAGLLAGSVIVLRSATTAWMEATSFSETIVRDVQSVALAAPEGSLLVVDAPPHGDNPAFWTWVWGWAMPFAVQPPFTEQDLTERVLLISTRPEVYCCLDWEARTEAAVAAWSSREDEPPAILLQWDDDRRLLQAWHPQESPVAVELTSNLHSFSRNPPPIR